MSEYSKSVRSREDQANLILDISEAFALNQEAPTTEFVLGQLEEAEARGAAQIEAALRKLLKALSCTGNAEDPDVLIAEREANELLGIK